MAGSRPLVRIVQGQLRGVIERSVNGKEYAAFKGIPYARPPVGDLRFRDPEPAQPWSCIMDTSKFGLSCAQLDPTTNKLVGSDDCLYLNVYTPSDMSSNGTSPKPVMVWIHGGLFSYGSGDDTIFGPDYIVEKDVLLVTINYRLNVFGFLDLEDEETTGNQGLKDQVMALKWVRENIANFGGDPKNVTIFGESAGGACVQYLTLSPLAKGLYHKAIAQSGVALNPWATTQRSPKSYGQKLAAEFGEKIQESKILVDFLRSIDALKLAEAESKLSSEIIRQGTRCFTPSVDDKSKNPFLSVPPKIAAQTGIKIPYMVGHTSHEGILYLIGTLSDARLKALDSHFEAILGPGVLRFLKEKGVTPADLRRIYFGDKPICKDGLLNLMQMQTDLQFVCGIHEFAEIQKSVTEFPTYLYNFSYDNGKSLIKNVYGLSEIPGACHTDEMPFMFRLRDSKRQKVPLPKPGSMDHVMTERVTQMWTNFAKTGNPTPTVTDTVPVIWKPVEAGENLQCLNIGQVLRMESTINVNKRFVKTASKL